MEWYHVCWPRLTTKRVEPVVSISWASCDIMHNAHVVVTCSCFVVSDILSMKNFTEKFHNKYNTHCYCVVIVICTNIIFYEIPEEAETLRITLPLGHLLKNWTHKKKCLPIKSVLANNSGMSYIVYLLWKKNIKISIF